MSSFSKEERVKIFTSLFKGRTDIFARRWEKWDGSVSGYSPVYKNWSKKEHAPLTDFFIERHLLGQMVLGLYPLLTDNTSYFIAVDFDSVEHIDSQQELLVNIADMAAGSILWKYSGKDLQFYNLIKENVLMEKIVNWPEIKRRSLSQNKKLT